MAVNSNNYAVGSSLSAASSARISSNTFHTGKHWILYLKCLVKLVCFLAAVNLFVFFFQSPFIFAFAHLIVIAALLVSAFSLLVTFFEAQCTCYLISPSRIQIKHGFTKISVAEFSFANIESVKVFQTLTGRYFDYGKVTLTCNSGLSKTLTYVAKPNAFLPK